MHFCIVEDFKSDQENLVNLIQNDCATYTEEVEISIYSSGEAFLKDFRCGLFNAVFLDIMLGDGITGIDTAWKIRELDEYLPIIFITTEQEFALDSYGVHAMDFLTKPVQPKALVWCMKRLRETLLSPTFIKIRTITKNGESFFQMLSLRNIIHTEAIRNGVIIHTTNCDIKTSQSHGEILRLLPKTGRFWEYGRGLIVNFSFVNTILKTGEIQLKSDERLFCSRRKLKDTISAYDNYQFMILREQRGVD